MIGAPHSVCGFSEIFFFQASRAELNALRVQTAITLFLVQMTSWLPNHFSSAVSFLARRRRKKYSTQRSIGKKATTRNAMVRPALMPNKNTLIFIHHLISYNPQSPTAKAVVTGYGFSAYIIANTQNFASILMVCKEWSKCVEK